jgi:hypothetical protein
MIEFLKKLVEVNLKITFIYLFDSYDDILKEFDRKLGISFKRKYLTEGDLKYIIGKMKKA